jgi:hypothetical protein
MVCKQRTAVGGAQALGILRILDQNRQAMQRTAALPAHDGGFRGACFGARLILRQRDHGIHGRVHRRDPGQAGIQQFERR